MADVLRQLNGNHTFEEPKTLALDSTSSSPSEGHSTASLSFQYPVHNAVDLPTSSHQASACNIVPGDATPSSPPATRRHTRQHKSLALPAFTFNPTTTAASQVHENSATPPQSPLPASGQPSPPKNGRHRRAHSEFIGGQGKPSPLPTREPNLGKDLERNHPFPLTAPPKFASQRGHRHRRSDALSSQDLSAISHLTTPVRNEDHESDLHNELASPPSSLSGPNPLPGHPFKTIPKLPSPIRVSFADNVEVIPRRSLPTLKCYSHTYNARPVHSSDGVQDQRHGLEPASASISLDEPADPVTTKTTSLPRNTFPLEHGIEGACAGDEDLAGNSAPASIPRSPNQDSVTLTHRDDAAERLSSTSSDGRLLSEDFDDDPTSAVIIEDRQNTSPQVSLTDADVGRTLNAEESIVDLDCANDVCDAADAPLSSQDMRTLRAKSFSAARHRMHSSGLLAANVTSHRRTESAPSLPVVQMERPVLQRLDSVTASEKGFEMENVFEEEEEESGVDVAILDQETCRPQSTDAEERAINPPTSSEDDDREDTPTPTPTSAQFMDAAQPSEHPMFTHPLQFEVKTSLKRANAPYLMLADSPSPGTKDFRVARESSRPPSVPLSASSAPCLDPTRVSLSDSQQESHPRFLGCTNHDTCPSSDGTPSLISSRSTIVSNAHRTTDSAASPSLSDAPDAPRRRADVTTHRSRGRKRGSIVSLLMTGSSGSKSELRIEDRAQEQVSSVASRAPPSEKRKHWYRHPLKFLRPRHVGLKGS